MELVIKIPKQIYKELTETAIIVTEAYPSTIERALTEGIVLPKGHGALKDVDAFDDNCDLYHTDDDGSWCYKCKDIANALTIIEADKEVEE